MKYRARCNKRPCQARRTIKGAYDPNDRESCHTPGCTGLMRKDVTRERLGAADSGTGLCLCDGVQWADMRNSPHRKGTHGCRSVVMRPAERPKHSPIPADEWTPF